MVRTAAPMESQAKRVSEARLEDMGCSLDIKGDGPLDGVRGWVWNVSDGQATEDQGTAACALCNLFVFKSTFRR